MYDNSVEADPYTGATPEPRLIVHLNRGKFMKELYFHEDFYCQVELLPMSALESSVGEMKEIGAFSEEHWDGTAWTALYVRADNSQHLKSLSIPIDSVAAKLDSILEPVDDIYTGYSTYRERCNNTRAWVLPCSTGLLADFDQTGDHRTYGSSTNRQTLKTLRSSCRR